MLNEATTPAMPSTRNIHQHFCTPIVFGLYHDGVKKADNQKGTYSDE